MPTGVGNWCFRMVEDRCPQPQLVDGLGIRVRAEARRASNGPADSHKRDVRKKLCPRGRVS
eukprot:1950984-Rhodomonas_salina.1